MTSSLDKRSVHINEEINLTIRILGAKGNIQAPRVPVMKGFDTFYTGRSSHISFVNNVSTSSLEFSYVLVPKVAGRFTLDRIEVFADGQVFRTDPVEIEVLADKGQMTRTAPQPVYQPPPVLSPSVPPVQQPLSDFGATDSNIFVKAWVDKDTVYTGEQILLTYSLYTRYDTRYEGFEQEPQVSGFWIEEFPMDRDIVRETVKVNDKRYVKADIKKVALFPTTAAEYTIQPGSIKVSIREEPQSSSIFDEFFNDSFFSGSSFFARRQDKLLNPPPIKITVKPLPEAGKPASFEGAVGNFRMKATIDKTLVKQNEPVTMKLVLEGEGNIETLNRPQFKETPVFKVYDADTSSQLFKTGSVIGGTKTFEIVFIPTQSGDLVIPSLEYSFFDPASGSYKTIRSQEFKIHVEPSAKPFELPRDLSRQDIFKKNIEVESRDIRYIEEKLPSGKWAVTDRWILVGLAGGNILLTFFVLWKLWQERTEKIYSKDEALRRRRLAKSQAESQIRHLKRLGRFRDPKNVMEYFEWIDKILTRYLSDKFNLSAYGITRAELEDHLIQRLGSEDPLYQRILELYRLCDESRFGKGTISNDQKSQALKVLVETISRVEKLRRES
ncbi:MAG: BatD family protein [Candidatus Omnitrophica bacterium]|nr:BatD family protein [Candidatus Omnitrophota bacterium]